MLFRSPERTVVNDEYRHTSLIRTLRERWSLGAPLTARDASAPDLAPLLSLDTPRAPEEWPEVIPQAVPEYDESLLRLDKPLTTMQKGGIFAVLSVGKSLGRPVPDMAFDTPLSLGQAIALMGDLLAHLFPNLTPM